MDLEEICNWRYYEEVFEHIHMNGSSEIVELPPGFFSG
jgi:hypothetical protein